MFDEELKELRKKITDKNQAEIVVRFIDEFCDSVKKRCFTEFEAESMKIFENYYQNSDNKTKNMLQLKMWTVSNLQKSVHNVIIDGEMAEKALKEAYNNV